ncbi:MAG: biotin/lipoyl-binding protein, partial [Pseudonocardia sp.]|nr:biotin/lipoyl-binding protein [Pseudonocardia sp.]
MTRHILRWTALAAVLATAACSGTPAPAPVVRVDRGIVATSVSASGTLVSITEQNLGFAEGGELAEVLVEVGDRVAPGQVLARLDNRALEQALEQSQAQLDQARAALDKIENGNQVEGAAASLEQSQEIVAATEDQVAATDASNDSAIERAKTQLDFDRSTLADAEETLAEDEESCDSEPTVTSTSSTTTGGSSSTTPTQDSAAGSATTPAPTAAAESTAAESTPNPACDRVASGETAVRQAEGTVIASETALETAEQRETVDAASGRLSIENARANVVSAQNQL